VYSASSDWVCSCQPCPQSSTRRPRTQPSSAHRAVGSVDAVQSKARRAWWPAGPGAGLYSAHLTARSHPMSLQPKPQLTFDDWL
jgi:hypothetical protein